MVSTANRQQSLLSFIASLHWRIQQSVVSTWLPFSGRFNCYRWGCCGSSCQFNYLTNQPTPTAEIQYCNCCENRESNRKFKFHLEVFSLFAQTSPVALRRATGLALTTHFDSFASSIGRPVRPCGFHCLPSWEGSSRGRFRPSWTHRRCYTPRAYLCPCHLLLRASQRLQRLTNMPLESLTEPSVPPDPQLTQVSATASFIRDRQ